MSRFAMVFSLLISWAAAEPVFVPQSGAQAHPIVAAVKIAGMTATAVFVIYWVIKSIKVIKHDEDDHVHLPD
ncbi:hypothetical protein [Hydrogenimonas urashimensis]|uniref:hypothetical protein n=1 Tax=Hydrogenimonas urashimensis TaxID=2740515 RepID=UPI001914F22F|nr:hypothetical protein [Hydrogenimonas urashimensis]